MLQFDAVQFQSLHSQAVFQSFFLVLASEMGDKTQLLALVLAARFRKPWAVMAGVVIATVLNHALASWAGNWISSLVSPQILSWILAGTFFAFALWLLIPDKDEGLKQNARYGAFLTTTIAFFFAEMGDKTQLATVALAAKFSAPIAVTIGSTIGMTASNGLAVFFGDKIMARLSMKWVRIFACVLFMICGIGILFGF